VSNIKNSSIFVWVSPTSIKLFNLGRDTLRRSSFALQTLPLPYQILVTIPTNELY
jgi:hypothetical protein